MTTCDRLRDFVLALVGVVWIAAAVVLGAFVALMFAGGIVHWFG